MPDDLSENTKANYRSKRNRIQRGIDAGFYTEKELPLALKTITKLNEQLGETNDTIRKPGRPRGEVLRIPKGIDSPNAEETMQAVNESETKLEKLARMAEESRRAMKGGNDNGVDKEGEGTVEEGE